MKKTRFRYLCNCNGHNNPATIEEALTEFLMTQKDRTVAVPEKEYLDKGYEKESNEVKDGCLAEYLMGCESIEVSRTDENDRESYIAAISLDREDKVVVRVYDYYDGMFHEVGLNNLCDCRDAVRFVIEYGRFDKEQSLCNAGELSDNQLNLLDEFLAAAERLNEAGVSLLWDEDGNYLVAANRDSMADNSFFRLEDDKPQPQGALLLSETSTAALDIEISHMSCSCDLYYYPHNQE